MIPGQDIFASVCEISSSLGLPVVMIGGHAVNAYGYSRTTLDVDFMIPADTLAAWRAQFEALGFSWQGQTEVFAKFEPVAGTEPRFPLDVMLVGRETWNKIAAESVPKKFGDAVLLVPKPLHMIALKLHALRNPARLRLGKDLADILHLIRSCQIDTTGTEFTEVMSRHASKETRELIEMHLRAG